MALGVWVNVGDVVDLTTARAGKNDKGEWLMARVKSERGPESVDLFLHGKNASEARSWDTGIVKEIHGVKHTIRKWNDKWVHSTEANVTMTKGPAKSSHAPDADFLAVPPDDLDDLPFA